jgi:hypothetical protein
MVPCLSLLITCIYCILYHLLHLVYAAQPSLMRVLICTYSFTPLNLCVLGRCWGIIRLLVRYYCTVGTRSTSISLYSLTSANHVYVTNKIRFESVCRWTEYTEERCEGWQCWNCGGDHDPEVLECTVRVKAIKVAKVSGQSNLLCGCDYKSIEKKWLVKIWYWMYHSQL